MTEEEQVEMMRKMGENARGVADDLRATATFTLRLPVSLEVRLREAAGDVPLARWIRRAIEERLERER